MVHSTSLPTKHLALVSYLKEYTEPKPYEEASKDLGWVQAMDNELDALLIH